MAIDRKLTEELRRYRKDLPYYCEQVLRIRTKEAKLAPLVFNRAQRLLHEKVSRQLKETGRVRVIVLKARQEGVSTYTAARFFRRVHLYRHQNGLVIADQRKRSQTLFGIYDLFHRQLPPHLRPHKRYSARTELHFDVRGSGDGLNSRLQVETAKDVEAGRASTLQLLHASEFAFWDHPEEVWMGLMQAVPDELSEVIIESTANGVGNLFHEMWVAAEEGRSGFLPVFLPWWVHEEYQVLLSDQALDEFMSTRTAYEEEAMEEGFEWEGKRWKLTPNQLVWRRLTIRDKLNGNERAFRQEYPSHPREAFLVSGSCFFDEEVLLSYERGCRPPEMRGHVINISGATLIVPSEGGPLRVWERPRADGRYVIFADTASGKLASTAERVIDPESERGGRDFSCATVLDTTTMTVVAILHGRIPPDRFARALYDLSFAYSAGRQGTGTRSPALIGVERNHSSGETVLRMLSEELRHPNLFYMRRFNQRYRRVTNRLGWSTTSETRMPMLDALDVALRERTIQCYDADTIRECFTFVRGPDGKPQAQEGCHDDRVIALAGALQMARYDRPVQAGIEETFERSTSPTGMTRWVG